MDDLQRSTPVEERVGLLERKIRELETRLSSLEGSRQPGTTTQATPPKITSGDHQFVSPISGMLVSKNFHKADYLAGDAGDSIEFVLLFKSDLTKDARAFKGAVVFKDLFDQEIMTVNLTSEAPIRVGGKSEWRGGIQFNQFLEPHQRLLGLESKDVTIAFNLQSVVYADGTRENFV